MTTRHRWFYSTILSLAFAVLSLDVFGVPADQINWGWNAYPPTFPNEAYGTLTDVDPDDVGDNQLFDVWCPDGEGPFPCYIYAHGGSFIGSSKKTYHHPGKYLPDDDVVFMNINYRLGLGPGPAIADGLAMVQYVKANAAKYKIDPEKIVLGGNSAGGIMMTEIIYTHQEPGIMGLWSINPWFQNDYSPARLAAYPIPVVQVAYDPYPADNNHSALLAFTHASDNWSLGLTSMFMGGAGLKVYTFGYDETYEILPQIWRDGAWIKNTEGVDTGEAIPTLGQWINEIAAPPGEDMAPPTPNPAGFSIAPKAVSDTAITMMAIAGYDAARPVEYRFIETSGNPGGTNSLWKTSRSYTDSGLTPGMVYSYQVQMRDAVGNLGTASVAAVALAQDMSGAAFISDNADFAAAAVVGIDLDLADDWWIHGPDQNTETFSKKVGSGITLAGQGGGEINTVDRTAHTYVWASGSATVDNPAAPSAYAPSDYRRRQYAIGLLGGAPSLDLSKGAFYSVDVVAGNTNVNTVTIYGMGRRNDEIYVEAILTDSSGVVTNAILSPQLLDTQPDSQGVTDISFSFSLDFRAAASGDVLSFTLAGYNDAETVDRSLAIDAVTVEAKVITTVAVQNGNMNDGNTWMGGVAPVAGDSNQWVSDGFNIGFSNQTFEGENLVIDSRFAPDVAGADPTLRNLTLDGGRIFNNKNMLCEIDLSGSNLTITANGGEFRSNGGGRNLLIKNARLTGGGDLSILYTGASGQGRFFFAADTVLTNFTGMVNVVAENTNGRAIVVFDGLTDGSFGVDFAEGTQLDLATAQTNYFDSVTFGTGSLADGSYTVGQLQALGYADYILGNNGIVAVGETTSVPDPELWPAVLFVDSASGNITISTTNLNADVRVTHTLQVSDALSGSWDDISTVVGVSSTNWVFDASNNAAYYQMESAY